MHAVCSPQHGCRVAVLQRRQQPPHSLAAEAAEAAEAETLLPCLPQGGQLVWIAPSGGRDRPTGDGEWLPAPFDGTAAELMRTMLTKAAPDGHLYPCSMSSWGIMPPPQVRHLPVTCFLLPASSSPKVAPKWAPVTLLHAVVGHLAVAAGPQHSDPSVFSRADFSTLHTVHGE